jgi:hypothetical protein
MSGKGEYDWTSPASTKASPMKTSALQSRVE